MSLANCAAVPGSVEANRRPRPYVELRFANTVRQLEDFSCGAAAMATIATFYFETPTSEVEALAALEATYEGDFSTSQQDGFSLTDLIRAANYMGYEAQAVAIEAAELTKLDGPVIVHLDKEILQHFVVLRRINESVAYVSDPIVGDTTMRRHDFEEQYTGKALAIWREGQDLPPFSRLTDIADSIPLSVTLPAAQGTLPARFHPIF
jgi:predicted double-glycine peptidase